MFPTSYGMNTQEIKNFLSQPKKVVFAVLAIFATFFLVSVLLSLLSGVSSRNSFSLNSASAPMMGAIPSSYGKGGYGGYAVTKNAYAPQIGQEAGQVVRRTRSRASGSHGNRSCHFSRQKSHSKCKSFYCGKQGARSGRANKECCEKVERICRVREYL